MNREQLLICNQWPALTLTCSLPNPHVYNYRTSSYLLEFHFISRCRSLLKGDSTHGLAIFLGKMSPFSSFMIPQDVVVMVSIWKVNCGHQWHQCNCDDSRGASDGTSDQHLVPASSWTCQPQPHWARISFTSRWIKTQQSKQNET